MRRVAVGFASLLAVSFSGPAAGESELDQIQNSEQPGSQINLSFGGGSGVHGSPREWRAVVRWHRARVRRGGWRFGWQPRASRP